MNYIDLFSHLLQGNEATSVLLTSMTDYNTLIVPSFKNDYDYVVNWCNLADLLYKNKSLHLTAELSFDIGDHTTNCYWYELLWRTFKLSERCINDMVSDLLPETIPANISFDPAQLKSCQLKIQQAVGCVTFVIEEINSHCEWAKRHMSDTWDDLNYNYSTLRVLGYWVTALYIYQQDLYLNAASTWHACSKINLIHNEDIVETYFRPKRYRLVESIHTNSLVYCNVALAKYCEDKGAIGYAIAHYRASNALGYILNTKEAELAKKNETIYNVAVPPPTRDIVSDNVHAVPSIFLKGHSPLGRVTFVLKGGS